MKTNLLIATALLSVGASLAVIGCSKTEAPADKGSSAVKAGPGDEEAKKLFETTCSPCHGTTGKGDGPAAAALNPKPRAYSDKAWQASVTDEQLKKVIKEGGAAVGKSASMPPLPPDTKPEVVDGLVKIVRGFK
ncbi:MAG: c-type cytochrome [Myxococcales bacterium]|jgi:cytochrome c553|nr:c-type cytochrome [Myxococcales bacterium]MBL0196482.1 c-type cytochrome [Myxococcales bacterium]HQY61967.1 c-type cytochrome [Polyangiaceae bacterium]